MSIDGKRLGLVIFSVAALGGCTVDPKTGDLVTPKPELGEASRQTFMAQVIDPAPRYEDAVAQSSGDQAARAIKAYREGKVEEPKAPNPTVSASGSGSGGGSGSNGTR